MSIPNEHSGRYIYHFTHLDNLKGLLKHGLLSSNEQRKGGLSHISIAAAGIQGRRAVMPVPCGPGGVVHDYVPFYLCKRSSMLLSVVQSKNVDQQLLIYFAFPISVVGQQGVVFTDASANTAVPPNFYVDPKDLSRLNWGAIDSLKWSMPTDELKQARMAEVLVQTGVSVHAPSFVVVWNDWVADKVRETYRSEGLQPPRIVVDGIYYFTKMPPEPPGQSLVAGPGYIKQSYVEAVDYILKSHGHAASPRFDSPKAMLQALRADLSCLPETAELVGLQSKNEMHKHDVGTHTLKVVDALVGSPEYKALNKTDKMLTELGAYLHDIGKGPKSRWAHSDGFQLVDPDHPIRSLEMLRRVFVEDVRSIKKRSVRVLAKLVCYHDLVGEILGKGRKIEQLEDVVETQRELDMLIALGKADMSSVNPAWAMRYVNDIANLRGRVLAKIANSSSDEEE